MTAAQLADEHGVSLRTVYRDVATLVAQGAAVEGEAGFGYILREDFFLPPLMFGADEADALILGLRLVERRGDERLARAAADALSKIAAVLPERGDDLSASGLLAGANPAGGRGPRDRPHLAAIRQALRQEGKLHLRYADKAGRESDRTVWPVALGFFESAEVLAAWCETRGDFRHFRLDRILSAGMAGERYPARRRMLLAEWQLREAVRD